MKSTMEKGVKPFYDRFSRKNCKRRKKTKFNTGKNDDIMQYVLVDSTQSISIIAVTEDFIIRLTLLCRITNE